MPLTALNPTTRYINPAITVVRHVLTIADPGLLPTRPELTNGVDLVDELLDWTGWAVEGAVVQSRSVGTRNVAGVPGMKTLTESSLTFHADVTGDDARSLYVDGLESHIAFMDGGDVPGQPMDVFKVAVVSRSPMRAADGSALAGILVKYAVRAWLQDAPIPT